MKRENNEPASIIERDAISTSTGRTYLIMTDLTTEGFYETMVFPAKGKTRQADYKRPLNEFTTRYDSYEAAEAGHDLILKAVKTKFDRETMVNFREDMIDAVHRYGRDFVDVARNEEGLIFGLYHSDNNSFNATKEYPSTMATDEELIELAGKLDIGWAEP